MSTDQNLFFRMPKVELHLHLDCSLSFDAVSQLLVEITEEEYLGEFTNLEKCANTADFFRCVSKSVDVMQSERALRIVVRGLFDQLRSESVLYAEIRFAPTKHLRKGLTLEEVVEIVADSTARQSKAAGIEAGVILCTLRNYSEDQSLQIIRLVERYIQKTCVAGFDIAGDEAGSPIDAHVKAFEYARLKGIPATAHAGEIRGAESVREVFENFQPQRIGHGVRSIEDAKLIDTLIKNDIHLEVCPTSNIKTNVFNDYRNHPIDRLFKAGLSLGINTDGRSAAHVTLTDEYKKLADTFGWGAEYFYQCNKQAISHAFISSSKKDELCCQLDAGYQLMMK